MATTLHVNTVQTQDGFTLDPLCLSIRFTGSAPRSAFVPEASRKLPSLFLVALSTPRDWISLFASQSTFPMNFAVTSHQLWNPVAQEYNNRNTVCVHNIYLR